MNILVWRASHETIYLAIPATSVPAERVFSGGADLVSKKRGSLQEDTIQSHLCLDSWL
jgi:hypothetical protein